LLIFSGNKKILGKTIQLSKQIIINDSTD